ncbi:hypothetical protein F4805DRAFT_103089 [Annulohypoxylon moriforme]|nr:hypothetical protein F4805DRAFT_103089 [Annulohypoxylon moriforme]
MSVSLSVAESRRRAELVDIIHSATGPSYSKERIQGLFDDGATYLVKKLASEDFLPTLSADYFSWSMEKYVWEFLVEQGNIFRGTPVPYSIHRPRMYGGPYCQAYLSYLFDQEQEPEVVEEIRMLKESRQRLTKQFNSSENYGRALQVLDMQVARTLVIARRKAAKIPVSLNDIDADFAALKGFVADEGFCCLLRQELVNIVESAAISVAEKKVQQLIAPFWSFEGAEEALTKFVSADSWNDILPRDKRLEVCERTLSRYPLSRGSVDAWVARMRI